MTADMSGDAGGAHAADEVGPNVTSLIDHTAWSASAPGDDPFDDRPQTVDCARDVGWALEDLDGTTTLAVDTGSCDYLTVTQPVASDVSAGTEVNIQIWHFELQGDGEAHLAVQMGDELIWEHRIPIPSDSELIDETVTTVNDHAAGDPLNFHLHNHGINSYNLIRLTTP